MKKHTHKRYCPWTDETLSHSIFAIEAGLVYGVYDHKINDKINVRIVTSYDEAQKKCNELNSKLTDPYTW